MLTACDRPSPGGETAAGQQQSQQSAAMPSSASLLGQPRPDFSLSDLHGQQHNIGEWDGKVLVLNFWATWCPPCVREMPYFEEMQARYGDRGLQFIGVAIDDKQMVQDFTDTMGVSYPILIGAVDAIDVSRRYGNRLGALPYTVIIGRDGNITYIQKGELLPDVAEKAILPLL
jgi:thiol-disulfide isomerase/thioredoxin